MRTRGVALGIITSHVDAAVRPASILYWRAYTFGDGEGGTARNRAFKGHCTKVNFTYAKRKRMGNGNKGWVSDCRLLDQEAEMGVEDQPRISCEHERVIIGPFWTIWRERFDFPIPPPADFPARIHSHFFHPPVLKCPIAHKRRI